MVGEALLARVEERGEGEDPRAKTGPTLPPKPRAPDRCIAAAGPGAASGTPVQDGRPTARKNRGPRARPRLKTMANNPTSPVLHGGRVIGAVLPGAMCLPQSHYHGNSTASAGKGPWPPALALPRARLPWDSGIQSLGGLVGEVEGLRHWYIRQHWSGPGTTGAGPVTAERRAYLCSSKNSLPVTRALLFSTRFQYRSGIA
ncbi:unnamed protein product [Gadus morhua 'NCC']